MFDSNRPIAELTVGELKALIAEVIAKEQSHDNNDTAYGIQGLANLFGISYSSAKRLKASGILDKAISQRGRTIVTNKEKARELFEKATHGRGTN